MILMNKFHGQVLSELAQYMEQVAKNDIREYTQSSWKTDY